MSHLAAMKGKCPFCSKETAFRSLTFIENVTSFGGFLGGVFTGGLINKVSKASTIAADLADTRSFPNYKCMSCGKEVMQCSECKEIIPYNDHGSFHVCGENTYKLNMQQSSVMHRHNDDVISKLERLGSLKEKGLLSDSEFEKQKMKILK